MILDDLTLDRSVDMNDWPFYLPAVRHIIENGLQFTKPITFIVGENGSGKSTIVEGIAEAYGLDVRGGHGGRKYGIAAAKGPLGQELRLGMTLDGRRVKAKNSPGFFLRSETAMGVFEYMSDAGVSGYGEKHLGEVSHGEGYIQVLLGRFQSKGLYLLDEPEAALSFHSCLALMERLAEVAKNGSQVICATHSPIIAALPGAVVLEVGEHGIRTKQWAELELVQHWQRYMGSPATYLKEMNL